MRSLKVAVVLLAAACIQVACDQAEIDPFENDGHYFTVFGYLDALETDHAVRVVPIRRFPEQIETPDSPQAEIDAIVTSTNLFTDVTTRWGHSLEKLDDGYYGHIFRASFVVSEGTPYRLEITRSDGTTTLVETRVPIADRFAEPVPGTLDVTADSLSQEVFLPGVSSPGRISVDYVFNQHERARVNYGRVGLPVDGGWSFTVYPDRDNNAIWQLAVDTFDPLLADRVLTREELVLNFMGVQVQVLDENWILPDGPVDINQLAQPGALSNVENGRGFWGSISYVSFTWDAVEGLSERMGYGF